MPYAAPSGATSAAWLSPAPPGAPGTAPTIPTRATIRSGAVGGATTSKPRSRHSSIASWADTAIRCAPSAVAAARPGRSSPAPPANPIIIERNRPDRAGRTDRENGLAMASATMIATRATKAAAGAHRPPGTCIGIGMTLATMTTMTNVARALNARCATTLPTIRLTCRRSGAMCERIIATLATSPTLPGRSWLPALPIQVAATACRVATRPVPPAWSPIRHAHPCATMLTTFATTAAVTHHQLTCRNASVRPFRSTPRVLTTSAPTPSRMPNMTPNALRHRGGIRVTMRRRDVKRGCGERG